ncbi:hypothetical protein DPMN_135197 [Dreissena polymorpha]|uniref:Uncharacterized protein n=1 Tax=Dreissena polymorpha TaxID=45954 RepID=A0A9D4JEF7_DREPO|nr:hypothetical protein DPMN_135197 [Dreissena polymorpha]
MRAFIRFRTFARIYSFSSPSMSVVRLARTTGFGIVIPVLADQMMSSLKTVSIASVCALVTLVLGARHCLAGGN